MSDPIIVDIAPKMAPIFQRGPRYKAVYGPRGTSKSWGLGRYTGTQVYGGRRCLVVREYQRSIEDSAKTLVEKQIKLLGLDGFRTTRKNIFHDSGGQFSFIGLQDFRAEGVKSFEDFDILWVMEAQTIGQLSLESLTPTIRKPGSELLFEWNPRFPSDPVDRFFRGPDGPPPNSVVIEMKCEDNPWFPEGLRQDMERDYQNDPVKAAHIWGGAYRSGAGGFFAGAFERRSHLIEPFPIPARWRVDRAHDWGSASPHATLWFAEADGTEVEILPGVPYAFPAGTLFVIAEDYGTGGDPVRGWNIGTRETAKEIADRIRAIDEQLVRRFPGIRIQPGPADNQIFSATPGKRSIHDDYASGGVRFVRSDKSKGTRVKGANLVRDRFDAAKHWSDTGVMEGPGLFLFAGCDHTARTVSEVEIDPNEPETYATDGEDHPPDVLRYRLLDKRRGADIQELDL